VIARAVAAALAASRRWRRDLSKAQALALIDALPAAIDSALPESGSRCRALCLRARQQLVQADEQPFADPLHWAAFFVAGDGAVSADTGGRGSPSHSFKK
jgi:CHAT domain-containing protein